ncbi:helix-turn-helix transcriptional regulator [Limosilactobacillus caecicola]|uniref:helix-turn-helix transcriptional regulator n=1 Tax=Limosilactobacillus caecicola TaxID=2941332 RepID=UPI0020422123|nr:helix-turn-helix domain-containing protein [Limosilactobacillus caecicola]
MLHRENNIRTYHTSSAADLLQEVMDFYNITQQDLADRIGTTQKHISDILNRKRYLNEVLALSIEKVMGISSELLLSLDANYKLQKAKDNPEQLNEVSTKSPLFLQRYDWVTA